MTKEEEVVFEEVEEVSLGNETEIETETIITIKDVVLASKYFNQVNCILQVLNNVGVHDYWSLQELPGIVRGPICGIDIYQFVATLNSIYEDYDKE